MKMKSQHTDVVSIISKATQNHHDIQVAVRLLQERSRPKYDALRVEGIKCR